MILGHTASQGEEDVPVKDNWFPIDHGDQCLMANVIKGDPIGSYCEHNDFLSAILTLCLLPVSS